MIKIILVAIFVFAVLYWVLYPTPSSVINWNEDDEPHFDASIALLEAQLAESEEKLAELKGQLDPVTEEGETTAPDYYIRAMKEDEILNSIIMKAIQDYKNENNDTTKRDAKYMRELLDKRQEALVPVWEMKAHDDVYNILDVIERHINELTDVSDNTYSMPYGWKEGFQMYNFHKDENVRMIVMEKLGGLGFEVTVKETIRPYYLYEVRIEGTVANLVISWGNNNNK